MQKPCENGNYTEEEMYGKPTPYFVRECFADNGESNGWAVDRQCNGSTFVVCFSEEDAMRVEAVCNTLAGLTDVVLRYHASSGLGKKDLLDQVVYWMAQSGIAQNPSRESGV